MTEFSNSLSDAEVERLACLAEEMAEAIQVIGKVIRHGYESSNPLKDTLTTNRSLLEKEICHVNYWFGMMYKNDDISADNVDRHSLLKSQSVKQWLHHQEGHCLQEAMTHE